ncbi:MAG TPA: pilus assembly protein PilM [Lacunisphaera sp.]|jgi:hypothetical protein
MNWPAKVKRLHAVLGLAFDDDRFHAVSVSRNKDQFVTEKSIDARLTLPLTHPEPAAVGQEIRARLNAADSRERACVVALPARWIMSHAVRVPAGIAGTDLDGFLQIEAEKGFPYDPDELQIARSVSKSSAGDWVTLFAVRRAQLNQLSAVLAAADLQPVSFTLGLAALPGTIPPAGKGRITIATAGEVTTMALAAGGGLVAFRTGESSEAGTLVRELRITVEQIPAELRSELHDVLIADDGALTDSIKRWAQIAGLILIQPDAKAPSIAAQVAENIALNRLRGVAGLEFLPPRPSRWSVFLSRYNSRRLANSIMAAAALAVLALAMFGWQQIRLWSLRSQWSAMATPVTALQADQSLIHEYRPWFDTSFHDLRLLRAVTGCFPDNGSVTAKSVEIRGAAVVAISGTARDNPSLLRTLDQLRKLTSVSKLKVEQIHGKTPEQFTINFRWDEIPGS